MDRPIRSASRELALTDLARRVGDDLTTLAKDHVELARLEIGGGIKRAAGDATLMLLGGVVALIGLAMLCVTAVVAVAPLIPALWLRLLIGAVVYLAIGSGLVYAFARKLRGEDVKLDRTRREVRQTAQVLKEQVQNG